MNKLRQSFRRKKDIYVPESSRPHQWQTDEEAVRSGKCSFAVKVTPTQTSKHTFAPETHRINPIDGESCSRGMMLAIIKEIIKRKRGGYVCKSSVTLQEVETCHWGRNRCFHCSI